MVAEYEADELADNSEDEKKLYKAKKGAVQQKEESHVRQWAS